MRQSTARVQGNAGELKRGDKVTIIGEQGTLLKVRSESTNQIEGWLDKKDIISESMVAKAKTLENSVKGIPAQASGKLKQDANLRLDPSRENDSNVVFMIPRDTKFEIIDKRRTPTPKSKDTPKDTSVKDTKPIDTSTKSVKSKGLKGKDSAKDIDKPKMDTWYEVRLPEDFVARVGWVYSASVEIAIPVEISTYENSGYKFVAWHTVGMVRDKDSGEVKNYLILEKKIGSSDSEADFDRIYTLAWDPESHGYYSIFVQSDIRGKTPLRVETDKNGVSNVTMTLLDKNGDSEEAHYEVSKDDKGKWRMVRTDSAAASKPSAKKH
ncbi:MAG TPA: hypothetical protein VFC63_07375 [Blastocatellia bacterium]|nr:hypothetical protein [Blastocatellia bacterium]